MEKAILSLSNILIIWMGALLVLKGEITFGQLIAFRILSGYVTTPLIRLASLWQNFQETALSIDRLSDIINNKKELDVLGANLPLFPEIKGEIKFKNVFFSFKDSNYEQLFNITFDIQESTFIALVGPSGAGKSILLKTINRLFIPTKGSIFIDDQDISKYNLYSLRNQIGYVPQESYLFEGTIEQNISLKEKKSLNVLCKGAALRYLLTRTYDYLNTPKTAIIKIKNPREYIQKLKAHNQFNNFKNYYN